jgi:DMSO/TMAO reductase YedYZ molybdopterin-dependent catalytic subunit
VTANERQPGSKPLGRRVFLGLLGAGAVGTVFGEQIQNGVGALLRPFANQGGGGVAALLPGASRFRIYTVTGGFPMVAKSRYALSVHGLVKRPLRLSYSDLLAMPRTDLTHAFQCVTGWRVPGVHWSGVLLRDVLALAMPAHGATAVEFKSYDGVYTDTLTLEEAHRSDVLVAYEMLGAPITVDHGGPVRLFVAPMYGYKSVKWLKSISLVSEAAPGFWEQQGYPIEAWVNRGTERDLAS